jgi:hypothetical protein
MSLWVERSFSTLNRIYGPKLSDFSSIFRRLSLWLTHRFFPSLQWLESGIGTKLAMLLISD